MSNCGTNNTITRPRTYLQFNDLVFTGTQLTTNVSESVSLKVPSGQSYTFKDGKYYGLKSGRVLIEEDAIDLNLMIRTDKWNAQKVRWHNDFIKQQLFHIGRLWAIDPGNQLVYCTAIITSYQPSSAWTIQQEGFIQFQVSFLNLDATWTKADPNKVFLDPWDTCDFLNINTACLPDECCSEGGSVDPYCQLCKESCCDLENAISYCCITDQMWKELFSDCDQSHRFVYNCFEQAKRDRKDVDAYFGETELCAETECGYMIGTFYSDTVVDSDTWTITLNGSFHDPTLTLGDNVITILGDYNGWLRFNSKGEIAFTNDFDNIGIMECIGIDKIVLPCNAFPTIEPGENNFELTGIVCDTTCIYFDYRRVTI